MNFIFNSPTPNDTQFYWLKLWQTVISPRFHWLFLKARFKANFMNESIYRRIATVSWIILLVSIAILSQSCIKFVLAVFLPLTILYNISALLQFVSEHVWGDFYNDPKLKSHGRFCGTAFPTNASFLDWFYWMIQMLVHFLVRVAILCGEMPEHDWHHKSPKNQKEWANGTYARQQEIEAGKDYIEFWGIDKAIEHVFQGLAKTQHNSNL